MPGPRQLGPHQHRHQAAEMKNVNDVTRYRIAMSLGSVVCSILASADPLAVRRAGSGGW